MEKQKKSERTALTAFLGIFAPPYRLRRDQSLQRTSKNIKEPCKLRVSRPRKPTKVQGHFAVSLFRRGTHLSQHQRPCSATQLGHIGTAKLWALTRLQTYAPHSVQPVLERNTSLVITHLQLSWLDPELSKSTFPNLPGYPCSLPTLLWLSPSHRCRDQRGSALGLTETVIDWCTRYSDKETRQNEWGFVKATPPYKTHDLQKIAGVQQHLQLEIADSCDCLVMIGHWKHWNVSLQVKSNLHTQDPSIAELSKALDPDSEKERYDAVFKDFKGKKSNDWISPCLARNKPRSGLSNIFRVTVRP